MAVHTFVAINVLGLNVSLSLRPLSPIGNAILHRGIISWDIKHPVNIIGSGEVGDNTRSVIAVERNGPLKRFVSRADLRRGMAPR